MASPHAAGHQAPHGLHASLAIRTRRSDAPWDGLPPPVLLVPVLGADEPTPRPAHIGTESLEAAATYFLRADGSLRSLDLAANYRVTVIRDRREATNREFKKIATLCTSIEGVALSDVLGIPPTGIELYLNNCYVCILSAIIQIDVNSVITVKRPTQCEPASADYCICPVRQVFISKFN